ncbi:MAG: PilZ domain-containing protein [Candidatus Methylomirabilales bacterium]
MARGEKMEEKRKHPRYAFSAPMMYREIGPVNAGRIHNLNEGGVMVALAERFPLGTPLELLIFLGERSVRAQAEVVSSQDPFPEAPTSYPHRLKFTRLDFQDQLTLELFIAAALGEQARAGEAL